MNLSIIFALLIFNNMKFNLHVHAWFDMSRVVFGQFVFMALLSSERKRFKMCLQINVFYIVACLVCQEYPILYANERYEIIA